MSVAHTTNFENLPVWFAGFVLCYYFLLNRYFGVWLYEIRTRLIIVFHYHLVFKNALKLFAFTNLTKENWRARVRIFVLVRQTQQTYIINRLIFRMINITQKLRIAVRSLSTLTKFCTSHWLILTINSKNLKLEKSVISFTIWSRTVHP